MKLLVTSSRKWTDYKAIRDAILGAKPDVVIHGAAPGADLIAQGICQHFQIDYRGYPAKWKHFGKAAGPIRNTHMLQMEHIGRPQEDRIALVLAFPMPGSVGTLDMIEQARNAKIPIIIDTRHL